MSDSMADKKAKAGGLLSYLTSWNSLTGFSSKEKRVNTGGVELGFEELADSL